VTHIRTKINEGSYIDAVQFSVLSNQPFQADLNLLERVIIQLIENSLKYDSTQVDIHIHQQNNQTEIDIIDNGSGISETDRPFIFDKFFRSGDENKREKTGTGLGLFIAKEFIELQKGTLTFKPNLPKGTVFTIKLPQ
jgi:two-component system phosphate regulon sensor histidine kinase PhoR